MALICILSQLVVFRKLTLKRLPFYSISLRFAHPAVFGRSAKILKKSISSHPYLYNPIKSKQRTSIGNVGSA